VVVIFGTALLVAEGVAYSSVESLRTPTPASSTAD
jgi:hypothetical protein